MGKQSKRKSKLEELLIFSDTHISKFTGLFHQDAFETGAILINKKLKQNPNALVLHLGDITDSGTYEDFELSKQILQTHFPTVKELYTIPGNHDMRNIGDQLWKKFFGERQFFIDTRETGGNMVILGIDSSEPDENTGRIGDRGIEAIAELETIPDDVFKILCFHHHLLPIPSTGRERSMILDAGDVSQVIWKAGIDVLITAHRHYPNVFSLSNGERRALLINSGTFSSFKTRGTAGHTFVDIVVKDKGINVQFHGTDTYSKFLTANQETQQIWEGELATKTGFLVPGENLISKICHFSDTHFTHGNEFLAKIYDLGIKMMIREKPNVLIHTGDLTNDSYPEDFALAKQKLRELRELGVPHLIVPGTRDLQPFGRELWVQQVGPLDPIYEDPTVRVLGINTGADASGRVGRSRMRMIKHEYDCYGDYKFFLVAMHHSVLPIPRSYFKRVVKDAGDVIQFLTSHTVPLVLSGLEHYATTMQVENTVFVNAGTFSSKKIRSRRLNTFNVISIYESGLINVEEVEIHSGTRHMLGLFRTSLSCGDEGPEEV
ncbi:MAG: metallophosphoesterase family protein [Candidatus Hodarchaeales archaeon]|jgi:3',5'-cyclic AMP phosphodiesterase CpdA